MLMNTTKAVRTAASWIQRILDVRLPMGAVSGLRTR
jgi:hypothetical protein